MLIWLEGTAYVYAERRTGFWNQSCFWNQACHLSPYCPATAADVYSASCLLPLFLLPSGLLTLLPSSVSLQWLLLSLLVVVPGYCWVLLVLGYYWSLLTVGCCWLLFVGSWFSCCLVLIPKAGRHLQCWCRAVIIIIRHGGLHRCHCECIRTAEQHQSPCLAICNCF